MGGELANKSYKYVCSDVSLSWVQVQALSEVLQLFLNHLQELFYTSVKLSTSMTFQTLSTTQAILLNFVEDRLSCNWVKSWIFMSE